LKSKANPVDYHEAALLITFSAVKMEVVFSYETSMNIHRTIRASHTKRQYSAHRHSCDNLQPYRELTGQQHLQRICVAKCLEFTVFCLLRWRLWTRKNFTCVHVPTHVPLYLCVLNCDWNSRSGVPGSRCTMKIRSQIILHRPY
jgi:hypothetical protein